MPVDQYLSTMSSGTRSSKSKTDDGVSLTVTVAEVEDIVRRAVSQAVADMKDLINNKLAEVCERISAAEARVSVLEERLVQLDGSSTANNAESVARMTTDLSTELQAVRTETRESLLASNDNEQYSRRNNLRICGLRPEKDENCCQAAAKFIKNVLRVTTVTESDIEVAHMTSGSLQSTANQQRRPTVLVRFCRRDKRDVVIRSRRILKGTQYAVTEDLTGLNVRTMNRLKNHERVNNTWSWNGKIFAALSNGKTVVVRPFQPVDELLAS